jgi:hypothetical protein
MNTSHSTFAIFLACLGCLESWSRTTEVNCSKIKCKKWIYVEVVLKVFVAIIVATIALSDPNDRW